LDNPPHLVTALYLQLQNFVLARDGVE